MNHLDTGIIAFYLVLTIIVGIIAGRSVKTLSDFSVGNRDFLTVTLIMTIFATFMDGEVILNGTTQGFRGGITSFLLYCTGSISLFIYGLIAPKVTKKFSDCITTGDIMNKIYGEKSQIITGVSSFFLCTTFVAIQFKSLSIVFSYFYDLDHNTALFISVLILLAYSVFGGIRAVTWTDAVQFFILFNAVPLVASVAVNQNGGLLHILSNLPETNHSLELFHLDEEMRYQYLAFAISVIIPTCTPPIIQRMLMSRDAEQTKRAYFYSAILSIPFFAIVILTGIVALYIDPNMDSNNAFLFLVDHYMPIGLKGFAIAGVVSVIMSTADSFMNTGATSFSHDFLKTILGNRLSDSHELGITKIITIVISALGFYLATKFDSLIELLMYSSSFYAPLISIPLLMGIFGIMIDTRHVFVAMFAGGGITLIWILFDLQSETSIEAFLPGFVLHFIIFLLSLYFKGNIMKQKNPALI